MKKILFIASFLSLTSCVDNSVDSQQIINNERRTLRSIMTRTSVIENELDTLLSMSRVQSDVNNLMMGRIVVIDSVFVLSLKKEDALFLGVSEEIYDKYLEYVERLNGM